MFSVRVLSKFLLLVVLVLFTASFAERQHIENLKYTDENGKKLDLYEELAKGRFVLIHASYRG